MRSLLCPLLETPNLRCRGDFPPAILSARRPANPATHLFRSPTSSLVRKYAPPETPGRPRHSRESGNPEGKGGTNHTQPLPTTRSFSYLGVPAPAGMGDWYENAPSNRPPSRLSAGETWNCRPMRRWRNERCSAGACPPQGSGWGVAESVVPIRCTKPQLRLFILWCAGANRHERLVENGVTRPQVCLNATGPRFVITMKMMSRLSRLTRVANWSSPYVACARP